jgi:hypothetical protein
MEKDNAKRPRLYSTTGTEDDLRQTHDEAETLFSGLPFKQRWIGFLHTVSACLETDRGALIPWIKARVLDMTIWKFYFLNADAHESTTEFLLPQFQIEKTPSMLTSLNTIAVPSKTHTTQLLMNYVREGRTYSTKFCNDHREAILSAPYFVCETASEAYAKIHTWLETEEGMKFTFAAMGRPVPDHVSEEEEEEEDDEFMCMICMDASPSTCVRPCGHVVVCSSCSIGLRDTADKGTCVRCRVPIEYIEDLSSGEVTLVE